MWKPAIRIIRPVFLCLLTVFVFTSGFGCATLPDVSEMIHEAMTREEPQIFSAEGPLSPEKSKALVEELESSVKPTDFLARHLAVMEFVVGSPPVKGNRAKLLVDGPATLAAMFKAIRNAKQHINIETYIFEDDEAGRKLADLLLQKQSRGVQVNLIYDSFGSSHTPYSFFDRLRDGGVNVVAFNPLNPLKVFGLGEKRVTYRDHRKVLIVDGRIAITGGINISQVYSSRPSEQETRREPQIAWRDTDVQIEGPAVAEFQKSFMDTWKRQGGPELPERSYFPRLKERGTAIVQVVSSTPGEMNRTTFIMYAAAISFAQNSVHLTNAYFAPDSQTVKALKDAAERGVDVKIIVPGVSDMPIVLLAGQYYYSDLLKSGVKLYQRRNALLHSKTAVVDGVWSTVGSTNMDLWSFSRNDEINAIILCSEFSSQMEQMFARDLAESDQILREEWEKRPLFPRIKEFLGHLFAHFTSQL